jgi:hypothetical protein
MCCLCPCPDDFTIERYRAQTLHEQVLVIPPPWVVQEQVSTDEVVKHVQMSDASHAGRGWQEYAEPASRRTMLEMK